ncbi:MAG: YhjD/YihY/BrkB family envelope integrity protein [Nitriliruptorales bacterium]|nr:YhjD/YihY/BrkB family envelope integrity protein [Nitriliruptorales bacterium]
MFDRVSARLPQPLQPVLERLVERDILLAGSSLAFYGLVSLLPLLLIAFATVDAVAGGDTLTRFTRQAVQSGSTAVGSFVGDLTDQSGSLSWVTVLAALWPATAYGGGLRRALVRTTEGEESAPGLWGRLMGLGLVFVLPAIVLAGMPLTFFLVEVTSTTAAGFLLGWGLALLVGVVAGTGVAAAIYGVFAPQDFGFIDTIRTAALVATVTTLFSLGFVLYLRVGSVEQRFGGATTGAVVLMGVWLFVANVLLLAGHQALIESE